MPPTPQTAALPPAMQQALKDGLEATKQQIDQSVQMRLQAQMGLIRALNEQVLPLIARVNALEEEVATMRPNPPDPDVVRAARSAALDRPASDRPASDRPTKE